MSKVLSGGYELRPVSELNISDFQIGKTLVQKISGCSNSRIAPFLGSSVALTELGLIDDVNNLPDSITSQFEDADTDSDLESISEQLPLVYGVLSVMGQTLALPFFAAENGSLVDAANLSEMLGGFIIVFKEQLVDDEFYSILMKFLTPARAIRGTLVFNDTLSLLGPSSDAEQTNQLVLDNPLSFNSVFPSATYSDDELSMTVSLMRIVVTSEDISAQIYSGTQEGGEIQIYTADGGWQFDVRTVNVGNKPFYISSSSFDWLSQNATFTEYIPRVRSEKPVQFATVQMFRDLLAGKFGSLGGSSGPSVPVDTSDCIKFPSKPPSQNVLLGLDLTNELVLQPFEGGFLPPVTSSDAGKKPVVNSDGQWVLETDSTGQSIEIIENDDDTITLVITDK